MTKRRGEDLDAIDRCGVDPGEGVTIMRTASGRALMVPASVSRLRGDQADVVVALQDQAAAVHDAQLRLDALVDEAREMGVSWGAIGFSVGLSPQGARQRWLEDD